MTQSHEQRDKAASKGGGCTWTLAVLFLFFLASPFLMVVFRDYEPERLVLAANLGGLCLIAGTIAGISGLAYGHRRCKSALLAMWIPVGVIVILIAVAWITGRIE